MSDPLYFINDKVFEEWLDKHHSTASGTDIYLYKKGHEDEGLTYEAAVRTALCYGWIDAVTHSCDEARFIQYFAPRKKGSNWSLSNMIRMRDLIDEGRMTKYGLKFFDRRCLENLDERIAQDKAAKTAPVEIPPYCQLIFQEEGVDVLFDERAKSEQRRFIMYIRDAKKEETRIRRCHKVVGILKGEKNNL